MACCVLFPKYSARFKESHSGLHIRTTSILPLPGYYTSCLTCPEGSNEWGVGQRKGASALVNIQGVSLSFRADGGGPAGNPGAPQVRRCVGQGGPGERGVSERGGWGRVAVQRGRGAGVGVWRCDELCRGGSGPLPEDVQVGRDSALSTGDVCGPWGRACS